MPLEAPVTMANLRWVILVSPAVPRQPRPTAEVPREKRRLVAHPRRLTAAAMAFLQRAIEAQVHRLVGFGEGATDLDNPPGDPGLFGPGSAAWRVHSDFTAMITGGIAALFLQMLHPRALAGVWDHSRWREDIFGRLKRTAQFVGGTTYGGTAEAERLIAKVRAIHAHVHGQLPDGTPYSADDPDLLTWVHVTEMRCFLEARRRYGPGGLEAGDENRYFAETAVIARKLGATWLP